MSDYPTDTDYLKKLNFRFISAAKKGNIRLMEILLENGADVDAQDGIKWTALHYACNRGHQRYYYGICLKFPAT